MSTILIVDDEVGIRELLADILSDEGYTVFVAENAESARLQIQQKELDLILLDIWMPDTDGITLLKELASRRMLKCPVIMMSGHGTIETAVEATKFGALAFLEKPITMQKLLETVQHGIEVKNRIAAFATSRPSEPEPEPVEQPEKPEASAALPSYRIEGTDIVVDFNQTLREVREAVEKGYLLAVMQHEDCQMTRVAKHAGLERTHLYRKLKSLNLEIPRHGASPEENDDETAAN